jgi:cyanate permease
MKTMNQNRLTGVMSALCMALMLGLMWLGDATPAAFALVGLGAGLMTTVCLLAEF